MYERNFAVAFDTPSIDTGVRAVVMQPHAYLYSACVSVPTAFDGTTPMCDVFGDLTGAGFFANVNGPVALGNADADVGLGLDQTQCDWLSGIFTNGLRSGSTPVPLYVVVSQDGTPSGGPVGGAAGLAVVTLVFVVGH